MTIYLKVMGAVGVAIVVAVCAYGYRRPQGKLLSLAPQSLLDEAAIDHRLVATTTGGKVLGYRHEKGVLRYARIPFAAPPVEDLRFQPPQPVSPWLGVLDTRQPGPSCIQQISRHSERSQRVQSEDCLSLTVTTPSLERADRPVVVWIHGGGLVAGSNGDSTYDGANFAARGDVVFVNVQYRLGVLGWLDVSSLGGENGQQSNMSGLLDAWAALEWVQQNIAQFGGDPQNVTLMGESAGSFLVALLLTMPGAEPLFDKAILQSGVYDVWDRVLDRQALLQRVLDTARVDSLAGLRRVDGRTMQRVERDVQRYVRSQNSTEPMPWYTPSGITAEALERAATSGKPILQGTLSQEYHSLILSYTGQDPYGQLADEFLGQLGLDAAQIATLVAQVKPSLPHRRDEDLLVDLATTIHMHYPHAVLAETYGAKAPVYSYLIDWPAPKFPDLGAFHGLDLPLVFGNFEAWSWALGDNPPQELSDQMQDAWIAFARTGNPSHGTMPDWPLYRPENGPEHRPENGHAPTRMVMRFGERPEVVQDPLGWVRDLGPVMDDMIGKGH